MSAKKQYVEIRVSTEQIESHLISCFSNSVPFSSLIAKTIVEHLSSTEMGLSHLYNAFSGVTPSTHVKIGDDVLVPWDNLPTWRMVKEKMREAGLYVRDKYVKAVVENIDHSRRESITIRFDYIGDKDNVEHTTYSVNPEVVLLANEEFPEKLGKGF